MMPSIVQLVVALSFLPGVDVLSADASPHITTETEQGVLIVRHGSAVAARAAEQAPEAATTPSREAVILARLADLGLIHIRRTETDGSGLWSQAPSWTYTPKAYHGYQSKPDWQYHERAGWRYDARSGWRYRPEPAWAQQPGAMMQVLSELPTRGQGWYITRWR